MNKLILLLFCAVSLPLFAAKFDVVVKLNKPSGIYKCGEPITITASVTEDGKVVSGKKVKYHIEADGGLDKKGTFVTDAAKPFAFTHKFARPGMLRSSFVLLDANGKPIPIKKKINQRTSISGFIGAIADLDKLMPSVKIPAGFNEYWAGQRKALSALPLKEMEKVQVYKCSRGVVYDIKVNCLGKRPVSGFLGVPVNAKKGKHAAILLLQGGGVRSCSPSTVLEFSKRGFLALDINAHGILNRQPAKYYRDLSKGELKNYYTKAYPTRESQYIHGMILRIMRALDYLKQQPEWNGKDLIVHGNSQGGCQAIIAAAVDPAVTLCRAGVPSRADFAREFSAEKGVRRLHLGLVLRKKRKDIAYVQRMLEAYSWVDPSCFAPNIKCPVYVSAGGCDLSVTPTAAYAIYNRLPAGIKKDIIFYPQGLHATSFEVPAGDKVIDAVEKRMKQQ